MRSLLDDLLDKLQPDHGNVNEVCVAINEAVRRDPVGTGMWTMMLETRLKQLRAPSRVASALLDALTVFDSEKTIWMAPGGQRPASNSTQVPVPAEAIGKVANSDDIKTTDVSRDDATTVVTRTPTATSTAQSVQRAYTKLESTRVAGIGSIVNNRYLLDSKLGHGCMGQVFIATDLAAENSGVTDAKIILEVVAVDLHQQLEAMSTLKDAVARTKRLVHPNIVKVFGVEHADGQVSVAMEYMSGRWLGDIIRQARKQPLPAATVWSLIEGVSNGLAYAHKQGIVHSNLNPCSIFVTDAGTPKIMGFELMAALPISSDTLERLETMTLRAYSEAYAVELGVSRRNAYPADDLYPLGVIAYELLTGKHPFQRHSLEAARQKRLSYEPIPDLSPRAAKLIADCLSFERAARPENATRFIKRMHGPALLRRMFGDRYSAFGTQRAVAGRS